MTVARFTHALVRRPSRSLADCALTHLPRQVIDPALATQQHELYVNALTEAGVRVTVLPEQPALPDAAFVEDMAVMLDDLIVLCRPGCPSRQPEVDCLRPVLEGIRQLHPIQSPGTLDGGDVLVIGSTFFVGLSARTNRDGLRQLGAIVERHGGRIAPVHVAGCLHLKTAISWVAPGLVMANPHWIDLSPFSEFEVLPVPTVEPWGANTLPVNDVLFVAASAPETAAALHRRGLNVRPVEISELQKAEAGLTCLSLLYGA